MLFRSLRKLQSHMPECSKHEGEWDAGGRGGKGMSCFPFCPSTPPSLAIICLLCVQNYVVCFTMEYSCKYGLNFLTIILNSNMFQALGRNMITGASDIAGTPVIKNKKDLYS